MRMFSALIRGRLPASISLVLIVSQGPLVAAEITGMNEAARPAGYLTVAASVALEPIKGVPPIVAERLVRMLDAASRPADLALLNYPGAQGDFRLRGDLKAFRRKDQVGVAYKWEVFDTPGACLSAKSGTELTLAGDTSPWSSVTDPILQAIASEAIKLVSRVEESVRTHTIEAAPSCAPPLTKLVRRRELQPRASNFALVPATAEKNSPLDAFEALRLVNNYRELKGLTPLTLDRRLTAAASALSSDMAQHDRLAHSGPDNADLERRLTTAGYPYVLAAENVAVGQSTVSELIRQWRALPFESQNLLLPEAKQMGIAVGFRSDTTLKSFWTVVIASSLY